MFENLIMSENLQFCEEFEDFRELKDSSEETNQGQVKPMIINGEIITLNPKEVLDYFENSPIERILLQIEEIKKEIKRKCEKAAGEISIKKQSYIKQINDLQIKQKVLENEKENLINKNKIKQETTILSKDKKESNNFVPYNQPFENNNTMNSDASSDYDNIKFTHEQCCEKKNDVCILIDSNENESNIIGYEEEIIYDEKTEKTDYQIFMEFLKKTLSSSIISIVSYINDHSDFKLLAIYEKAGFRITAKNYIDILKGTIKDIYLSKFWKVSSKKDFTRKNTAGIDSLLEDEKKKGKIPTFKILFDKKIKEVYKNYLTNNNLIDFGNFKAFIGMKTIKNDKKYNYYSTKLIEKIVDYISSSAFPIIDEDKIKNITQDLVKETNNSIYDGQFKYDVEKQNFYKQRKELMGKCLSVIDKNVKFLSQKYIGDFKRTKYDKNYLKKYIKQDVESYKKFANEYLKDIFVKEYNLINQKINFENTDSILNTFFNETKYIDILVPFLFDEDTIKIRDEIGVIKKKFKFQEWITYEDFFNDKYTKEEKEEYRKDFMNVMNGYVKPRKSRKETKEAFIGRKRENNK